MAAVAKLAMAAALMAAVSKLDMAKVARMAVAASNMVAVAVPSRAATAVATGVETSGAARLKGAMAAGVATSMVAAGLPRRLFSELSTCTRVLHRAFCAAHFVERFCATSSAADTAYNGRLTARA